MGKEDVGKSEKEGPRTVGEDNERTERNVRRRQPVHEQTSDGDQRRKEKSEKPLEKGKRINKKGQHFAPT